MESPLKRRPENDIACDDRERDNGAQGPGSQWLRVSLDPGFLTVGYHRNIDPLIACPRSTDHSTRRSCRPVQSRQFIAVVVGTDAQHPVSHERQESREQAAEQPTSASMRPSFRLALRTEKLPRLATASFRADS